MSEPTRVYRNDRIAVAWRDELCVHCKSCIQGLPAVFGLTKRPWVNIDGASPEEVRNQVSQCPSGALVIVEDDK